MDEALGACGKTCTGCPHTAAHPDMQLLVLDTVELQLEVHGHSHAGHSPAEASDLPVAAIKAA